MIQALLRVPGASFWQRQTLFGTLMKKDPVCGMQVNEITPPATAEYEKQTYYFCSADCLNRFVRNPKLFALKSRDSESGKQSSGKSL
jgi:YHS domain-containing protein